MECKFMVGQKVVCVDDKPRELPINGLKRGRVYTVAEVYIAGRDIGVMLEELNPSGSFGYYHDRFRPALPHCTDISMFKRMLVPFDSIPCDVELK